MMTRENPVAFTILIVDDEKEMCASLAEIFTSHGFHALTATEPPEAPAMLEHNAVDLVIMDIRMPQLGGMDLLRLLKARYRSLPVIMMTGFPSIDSAVQCMRFGALNFFVKPLRIRELLLEIEKLRSSHQKLPAAFEETRIVTGNALMLQVLADVERVASTDAPVLISGESGTGKELVAGAIHNGSRRAAQTFVKVNCASLPDTLLESEMFGHEKGAFTDATSRHVGKLELADRGTIFFDEIGDMSDRTQPKLLRVLQDGEFQRLGGTETLRTDVRLIAATNRDVDDLLARGTFREDLFYRLSVVRIHVPALRQRKDDLDLLIRHFLRYFSAIYGKEIEDVSQNVRDVFFRHDWPGNVRELRNCIERAVIFCDSPVIREEHLPSQYLRMRDKGIPDSLDALYEKLTRQKISEALAVSRGEKQKAARLLNISRKTLYNRMKKLGME
jgi:two-component system response regulator AtoC